MGGSALGVPGEQIQEGEEEVGVPTSDEPDAELRGPPPQPGTHVRGSAAGAGRIRGLRYMGGLREKGLYAALSGLHGGPAPCCALRLASNPFSLNAAPSAYVVTLLASVAEGLPLFPQDAVAQGVVVLVIHDPGLPVAGFLHQAHLRGQVHHPRIA